MDAEERMGGSSDGELSSNSSPSPCVPAATGSTEEGELSGPASPDQETILTAESCDSDPPSDGELSASASPSMPRVVEANNGGDLPVEVGRRLSKTSLPEEHVELDYEEDGMEDTGCDNAPTTDESRHLDNADDEKEEGEHTDDSGEVSSSDAEGEIKENDDDDDDCEEGEIKDAGGDDAVMTVNPTPTGELLGDGGGVMRAANRNMFPPVGICRFFLRGQCTWGMNCRFTHPGDNGFVGGDRPFGPGPSASLASRLGVRGRPRTGSTGQWNPDMTTDGDSSRPATAAPVESAWERGLRHAKEIRKKASKRKETDVDFEEKRMTLTLEEDKENKENESSVKNPPFNEPFEPDEYYDKLGADGWRGGQYENFEVRWTRNDQHEYSPPPFDRRMSMERGRMFDKRHDEHDRMRYSPDMRSDRRKEKFDKLDKRDRYRDDKTAPPMKTRGDEWKDPWRRSKSPQKKRDSSSRSRSRGRRRPRRSYSRGSGASSYSSSSYSSRSRSSSYSSYTSRSSSGSSSRSSRSSSRSRSRSPQRRNDHPSRVPAGRRHPGARTNEPPKSTVNKLGAAIALHAGRQRPPPRGQGPPATSGAFGRGRGMPPNRGASNSRRPLGAGPPQGPPSGPSPGPVTAGRGSAKPAVVSRGGAAGLDASSRGGMAKGRGKRNGTDAQLKTQDSTGRRRRRRASSAGGSSSRSSSVSSVSSAGSSSAFSSSGSADSDHLYRDIAGTGGEAQAKAASAGATRKPAKEPVKGAPPAKKVAVSGKDVTQPAQRPSSSGKPDSTENSGKLVQESVPEKSADKSAERSQNAAAPGHRGRVMRGPHPTGPSRLNPQVAPITMQVKSTRQLKYPAKMPEQERRRDRRPSDQAREAERRPSDQSRDAERRVSDQGREAERRPSDQGREVDRRASEQGREAEQRTSGQGREAERRPDQSRQSHEASRIQDSSRLQDGQTTSRVAEGRVTSQSRTTDSRVTSTSRQPTQSRAADSRSRTSETRAPTQTRGTESSRGASGRDSTRSKPDSKLHQSSTAPPATMATTSPSTKDLMKVAGQKSSIKLTLISKGEKATNSPTKKRPPDASSMAPPPAKRSAKTADTTAPSKPTAKPAPLPRSPAKAAAPVNSQAKGRPETTTSTQKVAAQAKVGAATAATTAAPVPKKKSTCMSSRREELLKQLKAVEEAIAKKRAKM